MHTGAFGLPLNGIAEDYYAIVFRRLGLYPWNIRGQPHQPAQAVAQARGRGLPGSRTGVVVAAPNAGFARCIEARTSAERSCRPRAGVLWPGPKPARAQAGDLG